MEFETLENPAQVVFEQFVNWTAETEDWMFQLQDYNYWLTNFDKFWLFAVVEKGTTNLVASISLARWDVTNDTPLYSIGMFYCVPKYRGQSHAKKLFEKVMSIVGDDNATLTGVVKMSDKYANVFGFNKVPDFWHILSSINLVDLVIPNVSSNVFVTKDWFDVDSDQLHKYDLTICSRDRRALQTAWFEMKNTFTKVVFDTQKNQIVGYSTIRVVSNNRLSVAPFYAENLECARVLFASLLRQVPSVTSYTSISFWHPQINEDAIRLLGNFVHSPKNVQSTPFVKSQFTKIFIESPHRKVYSITDCAHQFV